jgi:hypothetical protein
VRIGEERIKSYELADFTEAWTHPSRQTTEENNRITRPSPIRWKGLGVRAGPVTKSSKASNSSTKVGRAVLCPPQGWSDTAAASAQGRRARSDAPYRFPQITTSSIALGVRAVLWVFRPIETI